MYSLSEEISLNWAADARVKLDVLSRLSLQTKVFTAQLSGFVEYLTHAETYGWDTQVDGGDGSTWRERVVEDGKSIMRVDWEWEYPVPMSVLVGDLVRLSLLNVDIVLENAKRGLSGMYIKPEEFDSMLVNLRTMHRSIDMMLKTMGYKEV